MLPIWGLHFESSVLSQNAKYLISNPLQARGGQEVVLANELWIEFYREGPPFLSLQNPSKKYILHPFPCPSVENAIVGPGGTAATLQQ